MRFPALYIVGDKTMRRKREFIEDAFYHVTSRTNDKIRVFDNNLGRKIMLMVLQDAKRAYLIFCVNAQVSFRAYP